MVSNELKKKIILKRGYQKITGWMMEYEKDESHNNVIVTVEDMERFQDEKPIDYFWHNSDDYCRDLDDAWECVLDDYSYEKDLDLNDEELEKHIVSAYEVTKTKC